MASEKQETEVAAGLLPHIWAVCLVLSFYSKLYPISLQVISAFLRPGEIINSVTVQILSSTPC